MTDPSQNQARKAAIVRALDRFCGADQGRSVSFKSYAPLTLVHANRGGVARPAASVMKLPLVMSVLEGSRERLEETVPISAFPATRYVSVLAAFEPTHRLSVREICRLAVVTSDNPLTVHLQGLTSFDDVNALLRRLGLDPACTMKAGFSEGELGPRNRGNLLTADSCIRLLEEVSQNAVYGDAMIGLTNNLRNNRIPSLLPETATVAHKTGSLNGVVNDIGLVSDAGGALRFAVAFLTDAQTDAVATSNDIAQCCLELYQALGGDV